MGTAILIDGAFFLKRFRRIEPTNYFNAERADDMAWRWAMAHLNERSVRHELYRIFFYDCPPLEKQMRNPISRKSVNFKASDVDMRIGIDISALALKGQIDQIVLMAGDADFVPAAKLARREGVDFILDPMWLQVPEGLHEQIDGKRSTCPKPEVKPVDAVAVIQATALATSIANSA